VDRAALDAAITSGIEYTGWCPLGGWAEDYPKPPGLLPKYPNLKETPSAEPNQRTEWNVRDSDATLILVSEIDELANSSGTVFTERLTRSLHKPSRTIVLSDSAVIDSILKWLSSFEHSIRLNVAGPRESESPGIYERAIQVLTPLLNMIDLIPGTNIDDPDVLTSVSREKHQY